MQTERLTGGRARFPRLARACFVMGALVLFAPGLLVSATPVAAHTGFGTSEPGDGEVVDGPLDIVIVTFTGPAEPTGPGFKALDATGEVQEPVSATSADGAEWQLRFDPPLTGDVGVRWSMLSPDGHVIEGAFSFTVDAPESTTSLPSSPSTTGPTTTSTPSTTPSPTPPTTEQPLTSDEGPSLDEFLDGAGSATGPRRLGALARVLVVAGSLVGVGALVFAALVVRDEEEDVPVVLCGAAGAGVMAAVGAGLAWIARAAVIAGEWSGGWSSSLGDVLGTSFGTAVWLRLAGGAALALGAWRLARSDRYQRPGPAYAGSALSALGALGLMGAYLFDGHTVVKGNRIVTAVADMVHVGAAAVWLGGVAMLAVVLWHRVRQDRPLSVVELGLRFSVVATAALVVVGLAGVALAFIVLDDLSDLFSTDWGRTLVAKVALVLVAAVGGAYNHRVAVPQLAATPDDVDLLARFRKVVTFEAVALVGVVVATALLMGAEV